MDLLEPLPDSEWTRRCADHLLWRARFGAGPAERLAFYELGRSEGVEAAVASLVEVEPDWGAWPFPSEGLEAVQKNGLPDEAARTYAVTHWFLGQMEGLPGVAGKMFKFWLDHFPVDIGTTDPTRRFPYLRDHLDLLRRNALGRFGDLVVGVSWSAAMIEMLDLHLSQRDELNENFARELMELFMLGVDAGYSEADVVALARALTGRRLRPVAPFAPYLDESTYFGGARHGEYRFIDPSEKVLLGRRLPAIRKPSEQVPGERREHGAEAIAILLDRPECGRHLARKIWRYFASPDPAGELVAELGDRLRVTHGYALRPFLRELFASRAFHAPEVVGDAVKDPVDLVVSAVRVLEMPVPPARTATLALREMGFDLVHPPNIDGWPEPERAGNQWLAADRLMARLNFPKILTHGNVGALTNYDFPDTADLVPGKPDLGRLVPPTLRGESDWRLLLRALADDRLSPLVPLGEAELELLASFARRRRPGASLDETHLDVLAHLLALPNFQIQ